VQSVFIDASHERDETIAIFRAWENAVVADGAVAFHDYIPAWPGVVEAIHALGPKGRRTARSSSGGSVARVPADEGSREREVPTQYPGIELKPR
jgi:hypothetical protein